jgi:glycosyltransferase involved in cell wall biosynthesis
MRIAQVNVYFNPFMVGGAEWYVYNLSRELVKMGNEVDVFTVNIYNGKKAPASESIEGINVHRLPLKLDWTYRLKVWDGLTEMLARGGYDVIHAYDYAQPHSLNALEAGRRSGSGTALTVFDVHSMIPRTWYKQIPMSFMDSYFAKRTLPRAGRVLVRAPNLIPSLLEIGARKETLVVTPSGVRDESLGSFDGDKFLKKYGITGSPIMLFMGRLNPLKGPENLLLAAPRLLKQFPEAAFVFVGPEQSGYLDHLRTVVKRLGIESRVFFTGPIYEFQEKMEAYASCDVFVLPTSYEGTSQAVFEAMSQAKPIVATDVGGIPFQIKNGREGTLVPYGDVDALAEGVESMLKDPVLAAKLGKNARDKVQRDFRYSMLASNMVKIYEEIDGDADGGSGKGIVLSSTPSTGGMRK